MSDEREYRFYPCPACGQELFGLYERMYPKGPEKVMLCKGCEYEEAA